MKITQIPAIFIVKNSVGQIWAEGVLFTNGEVSFLWRDLAIPAREECEDMEDFLDYFTEGDELVWL